MNSVIYVSLRSSVLFSITPCVALMVCRFLADLHYYNLNEYRHFHMNLADFIHCAKTRCDFIILSSFLKKKILNFRFWQHKKSQNRSLNIFYHILTHFIFSFYSFSITFKTGAASTNCDHSQLLLKLLRIIGWNPATVGTRRWRLARTLNRVLPIPPCCAGQILRLFYLLINTTVTHLLNCAFVPVRILCEHHLQQS